MSKIRITLNSDLCSGSGQGFSSVIDTDVYYDRFGLPQIPAKRLKGCLREVAEYIDIPCIDEIFGRSGNDKSGAIRLSNAVVQDYSNICEALENNDVYSPEEILSVYTYTRAQTAIESEHAKENSLRFTRVVKQYSPLTQDKMVFEAECECEGYEKELAIICKALRNIGMMRTRGLGAVKCEYIHEENALLGSSEKYTAGKRYRIDYTLKLTDNLMISSLTENGTRNYISGTEVIGNFARMYLRDGKSADETFEDLFLRNKVIFSNLYICDGETVTVPAPAVLGKIKSGTDDDGKLVNMVVEDEKYRAAKLAGEVIEKPTMKPLKEVFCNKHFQIIDVDSETVYHHRHGDDALLYTQTCISAGQVFGGSIEADGKYMPVIEEMMNQDEFYFGKSKTAQYSKCKLLSKKVGCCEAVGRIHIPKGEEVVFALESDVVINDTYGNGTTDINEFGNRLGINGKVDSSNKDNYSVFRFHVIHGYNAKWNLRKLPIQAFAMGSVFVCKLIEDMSFDEIQYIGEKTGEGFGRVRAYLLEQIGPAAKKSCVAEKMSQHQIIKLLCDNRKEEKYRSRTVQFFERKKDLFTKDGINAAFVGRVSLMIEQAKDYKNLEDRVMSIKSEGKRKQIKDILKELREFAVDNDNEYESYWRICTGILFRLAKYQLKLNGEA